MVSLLVVPERAHGLGLATAVRILDQMARILPELLAGFARKLDIDKIRHAQEEIGRGVAAFQALVAESKRLITHVTEPNPGPCCRAWRICQG